MYQILKGFQIISVHFLFLASVPKKMSFQNSDHYSKRRFTPAEDQIIQSLAKIEGSNDWNIIAQSVKTKSARQCRDRWNNYLNPNLNNTEWTKEDDELLFNKIQEFGFKWTTIAKFFNNRTDSMIKNRYKLLVRREKRFKKKLNAKQNQTLNILETKNENADNCEDIQNHNFDDDDTYTFAQTENEFQDTLLLELEAVWKDIVFEF